MRHEFISSEAERAAAVREADHIVRDISRSLSRVGKGESRGNNEYWSQEDLKDVLGPLFLGKNAVLALEQTFRESGIDVKFPLDRVPDTVRCSRADLDFADANNEMLILYIPEWFLMGCLST